jgi:hypothetical protein
MSTLEKIKADAATLPPDELYELAKWIEQSDAVRTMQRAALVRDIEVGIADIENGRFTECKNDEELRAFMEGIKARGRAKLGITDASAA